MTDPDPRFHPFATVHGSTDAVSRAISIGVSLYDEHRVKVGHAVFASRLERVPSSTIDAPIFDVRFETPTIYLRTPDYVAGRRLVAVGIQLRVNNIDAGPEVMHVTDIPPLDPVTIEGFEPGVWLTPPVHIARMAHPNAMAAMGLASPTPPATPARPPQLNVVLGMDTPTSDHDLAATCRECQRPVFFADEGLSDMPLVDITTRAICAACLAKSPRLNTVTITRRTIAKYEAAYHCTTAEATAQILSYVRNQFPTANVQITDDSLNDSDVFP